MEKFQHRVFKIEYNDFVIVYIPTLYRLYRITKEAAEKVPSHIKADIKLPVSRWDNLPDYTFFGTNLILTNKCNLACAYCYGEYSPKKDKVMTEEVAYAAVDYIIKSVLETGWRKLVYLNFFGGEPTQSWDLIVDISEYLRKNAAKYNLRSRLTITTNGCMPLENAQWLARNVDGINISIDGFKSIQDAQRSQSFDRVFPIAQEIYRLFPSKLRFRSTVSASSVEYLPQIVDFFGKNFSGCPQMYEPLFTMGRGVKNGICAMPDADIFFRKYIDSISIAKRYGSKLKTSVLKLTTKSKDLFCGVAARNFMITPDSRATVCNRMVEEDINEAANLFTYGKYDHEKKSFIFDNERYQWLKRLTVLQIPECIDCFAGSICKGDCPANKAALSPKDFWIKKSFRCEAIKRFAKNILLYVLENGYNGLLA